MSTSGIIAHYIRQGCQAANPKEIHGSKWKFCVQYA